MHRCFEFKACVLVQWFEFKACDFGSKYPVTLIYFFRFSQQLLLFLLLNLLKYPVTLSMFMYHQAYIYMAVYKSSKP